MPPLVACVNAEGVLVVFPTSNNSDVCAELGLARAAAIIPAEEASTDDLIESVISHCQETIGSQLTPRRVFIVDELPRTEAGKLYRHRLTAQFSNRSG